MSWAMRVVPQRAHDDETDAAPEERIPPAARASSAARTIPPAAASAAKRRRPTSESPKRSVARRAKSATSGGWSTYPHASRLPSRRDGVSASATASARTGHAAECLFKTPSPTIGPSHTRLLAKKETVFAALIASAFAAPHVVWQVRNGFPTREFARAALSGKNEPYGVLGFIGQEMQLLHPLFAPLLLAGLVGLLVSPSLRRFRPLGVAYVLVAALIVVVKAKAYYLAPAAMWLFAAGGVVVERATAARPRARIAAAVYGALAVLAGLALAPMAMPILPVATFQPYARALGALGEQKTGEKNRPAALPQIFADMYGWPELAHVVEEVVLGLSAEECEGALIFAHNYGEASAIEHFGHALPKVASGNTGWWLFGLPRSSPSVVVAVGDVDRALLDELFEDVHEVARFDHPLVRANERDIPITVCRRPKVPFETAWPRLKLYR